MTTATVGVIVTLGYGRSGLVRSRAVSSLTIGYRRLITGCLLGMGGSYILIGLAPSMVVIALALVLWGLSASVYHPAGLSLTAKIEQRGTGLAYHGVAGTSERPRPARRRSSPAAAELRTSRSSLAFRRCSPLSILTGEFRRDGGGDGRD